MKPRVPVTVISGFLGAGKTTLLKRILSATHEQRLAVIVNDFARLNIDERLIAGEARDIVSLSSGCVCCSIRGELVATVARLFKQCPAPRYILVECSGVSDPEAVKSTLMSPLLRPLIQVDGMVAVVDASQMENFLVTNRPLMSAQIRAASTVLLNKTDLTREDQMAAVKDRIREIVPGARILECRYADVHLPLISGVEDEDVFEHACSHSHSGHTLPGSRDSARADIHGESPDHAGVYESVCFRSEKPFDHKRVREWIQKISPRVLRAKGFIFWNSDEDPVVKLDVVGRWARLSRVHQEKDRLTRLVFIGKKGWPRQYDIEKKLLKLHA